jgi:propionate CoA-transferase
MTASEAVKAFVKDGCTVAFGGFVGNMHPEEITYTIKQEFLASGHPRDLTIVYAAGQGDGKEKGLNNLGIEGIVAKAIGGHWGLAPKMQKLALENKVAAYNLPQGVISHLFRDIAARKPGVITHVGLKTFVDPRVEGGKLNDKAREAGDVVQLININGEEKLLYKSLPIDVSIIRGTYADTHGNISLEHEAVYLEVLSMAQAAKTSGGKVIVQVEDIVEYGSLNTRLVKIPGIYVDAIVKASPGFHMQTNGTPYNPAYSGEIRVPVDSLKPLEMSERKIMARRAAMELVPNSIVNLGIGVPEGVAVVAAEEGLGDQLTLTAEAGTVAGIPAGGADFGAATNPDCILDQPYQFDFYDGGNLDVAYLGLAEMDKQGNINVSRFGPRIAGCGGFINITQNAKKVVYCGTFTAGGLKVAVEDGKLKILQEGKNVKLVDAVEQVTFSGEYAQQVKQPILYVTERAVFKLTPEGVELIEVAPGIDIEKDVLAHMAFKPIIKDVKLMDARIFREEKMGLTL